MIKLNEVELISLSFEHLPEFKCILALKQKITKEIPEAWEINLDVKATLAESLIKFAATADKAPIASLEFTHTYTPKSLAAKLTATYKTLKTEGNVMISEEKGTYVVKVDAIKGEAKIVEFIAAYEPTAEKIHVVKVKAVYEGKTLIDVVFKFNPDMKDATVELQEAGKNIFGLRGKLNDQTMEAHVELQEGGNNIFGLRGKLIDHTLEAHVAWLDAPLIDLKTEFKGELILNTRSAIDMKENALEAHIKWNDAPLIDLKTEFKAAPYTFNMEFKYQGKALLITNNVLDIKAKTLKAMINIDAILELVMEAPESWVIALEGNMVQRRDLTTLTLAIKKADKLINLEVSLKTSGKIDMTLRPASMTVDVKTSTKGFAKDQEAAFVLDIKKNADLFKTSLIALINKVEQLNTAVEFKAVKTEITLTTDLTIAPLNVNAGFEIKLDRADALTYSIVVIADKTKAKDTTLTISGMAALKPTAMLLNIKAILPTRTVVFVFKHALANRNIEHLVSFSWEEGKTTGYSFTP